MLFLGIDQHARQLTVSQEQGRGKSMWTTRSVSVIRLSLRRLATAIPTSA